MIKVTPNYYDISILPQGEAKKHAIELSDKVANRAVTRFVLGNSHYIPHITLYHVAIKRANFKKLIKELQKIVDNITPIELNYNKIVVYPMSASAAIQVEKLSWFLALHKKIVRAINPLRNLSFNTHKTWGYDSLPKELKRNITRFGSPFISKHFDPHVTLSFLSDRSGDLSVFKKLKLKKLSLKPGGISVCQLALPGHTCQKEIVRIPF